MSVTRWTILFMDVPFIISDLPVVQERQAKYLRAHLSLSDEIGLALRATRRGARKSQREYARTRGWSAAHQARLETRAEECRLGQVVRSLWSTSFGLLIASGECTPTVELGLSVPEIAEWVHETMTACGATTRSVASECGLSQTMVVRVCSPQRADSVPLRAVASLIGSLGASLVVAQSTPAGLVPVDPQTWPVAAVIPRSRGNGRRLAAHGWARRQRPWWFRWDRRPHLGMPPVWTAEAPTQPRWDWEPNRNALAPPPPRPAESDKPHVA